VVDWSGWTDLPTADAYRLMAEREVRDVSPTYERLCLGVADDPKVVQLLETLPPPKRQPNLLLAAARLLGAPLGDYPAFAAWVVGNWAELSAQMTARRTQTNEPGRCAALLPALARIPGPLVLVEVGASAGLCLFPDRYSYRYDHDSGSTVVGTGRPTFPCHTTGRPAAPSAPEVVARAGLDLHPLDVTDPADVAWLQALVWPEQTDRAERLRAAVETVRADPPRVVAGDLLSDVDDLITDLRAGLPSAATVVVFHTAVLAYVDRAGRSRFEADMRARLAANVCHWVSNEGPAVFEYTAALQRQEAGFVLCLDGRPLARTAPHGEWLQWLPG
jgi:hypothetical protein